MNDIDPIDSPDTPDDASPERNRPIKSFVLRAGRVTTGQQRALDELWPVYGVEYDASRRLDLNALFGRDNPKVLEIGFGMGATTADIAEVRPDTDFLGVEVHLPGVGSLLKLVGEKNLTNIRVIRHDAVEVLRDMLPEGCLSGVHIYFPDPWHKKRHNKRRLIQPAFVANLVRYLKPGGYLHLATDWEEYAQQMLEVLSNEPALENTADGYAPRPEWRPLTKFEARGLRLGHGVWDLVFKKK